MGGVRICTQLILTAAGWHYGTNTKVRCGYALAGEEKAACFIYEIYGQQNELMILFSSLILTLLFLLSIKCRNYAANGCSLSICRILVHLCKRIMRE
jgi:hypothetical protein